MTEDRNERIRRRAHELWEQEGRPHGRHEAHWQQAESEIGEDAEAEDGEAGTTDQRPRWEGPPANRPRGYLPANDDPSTTPDATGETLAEPGRSDLSDALRTAQDVKRK